MFTTIATRTNHRGAARTEANQRINALIEKVNEGFARGNIDAKASKVNFEGVIVIQVEILHHPSELESRFERRLRLRLRHCL